MNLINRFLTIIAFTVLSYATSTHTMQQKRLNEQLTCLHKAIKENNKEIVSQLLKKNPTLLRDKDEKGYQPIHHGAAYGNKEILYLLIESGKKQSIPPYQLITTKGPNSIQPIHTASYFGNFDILNELLQQDPTLLTAIDDKDNQPIHFAAINGDLDIVNKLLEIAKKDGLSRTINIINSKNINGETAATLASKNNKENIVKILYFLNIENNLRLEAIIENIAKIDENFAVSSNDKEDIIAQMKERDQELAEIEANLSGNKRSTDDDDDKNSKKQNLNLNFDT